MSTSYGLALGAVCPDLQRAERPDARRQRPHADDIAQIADLGLAQYLRQRDPTGNQFAGAACAEAAGERHGASHARAMNVVFALAFTRRDDFRIESRAILVGHLQCQLGAAVRHAKAKAQAAPEEGQRSIVEQPDLDRGAAGAQIERVFDLVRRRAQRDLDFRAHRRRAARRVPGGGSWLCGRHRENHRGRYARIARRAHSRGSLRATASPPRYFAGFGGRLASNVICICRNLSTP